MKTAQVSQHQKVNRYYDNTAREYRLLWSTHRNLAMHFGFYDSETKNHNDAVARLNEQLANALGISDEDRVVDAGCGLGGTSIWLATHRRCSVIGINIVPWQVELARSKAKEKSLGKLVNFIKADFAQTGLPAKTFTLFIGIESIVHAQDKKKVIEEAYRLLKPGGRLVISEYIIKDEPLSDKEKAIIEPWLDGWAMPSLHSEKEYNQMMKQAGFSSVNVLDWTDNLRPSFERIRELVKKTQMLLPALRTLKLVNSNQAGNLLAAESQMAAFDKGLWRYKVIIATKR